MSQRERLLRLTRIAFLDGLALSLLSLQFVVPPLLVVMLVIVPAVIALQIYHAPDGFTFLSLLVLVLAAYVLYGPVSAVWTAVYAVIGAAMGLARRAKAPYAARLLVEGPLCVAGIAAAAFTFAALAGMRWADLAAFLSPLPWLRQYFGPLFAAGVLAWGLISSAGSDAFLQRVLNQMYFLER
jgi:hypothetical protein